MATSAFFDDGNLQISAFAEICLRATDPKIYPHATHIDHKIVVYDGGFLRDAASSESNCREIKSELANCLKDGPGIFVVKNAYSDVMVVDKSTAIFRRIVADEQQGEMGHGDHFGNNERIWNSMQKGCLADPELFVEYYGNPIIHIASEAWLGPNYRVTAQMNNVKPGGMAQSPHRDYHLGFQSQECTSQYPAHAQIMSQFLTLQGAVAHCDMPTEKGPTKLLPFSQLFEPGYVAYQRSEFIQYFEDHSVQLPLSQGDMIFFNPAVFHAGGQNTTAGDRVANLLQISSSFGRTMETIDNRAMINAVYPVLLPRMHDIESAKLVANVISVIADGYAFPTNLDSDPPIDGNGPRTQRETIATALAMRKSIESLNMELDDYDRRRLPGP